MTIDFRPARMEDAEQIYRFVQAMPAEENGFVNEQYGITREQFMAETLPAMIAWSRGEQLKEGYVPETDCFLYVDGEAAGMFKLRHHLNAFLENGPGHIGYGLLPQYRGKGLATEGLRRALAYIDTLLPAEETEVYFSVNKNNPASLKVQLHCGAYIHHEDEVEYYTRIPRKK